MLKIKPYNKKFPWCVVSTVNDDVKNWFDTEEEAVKYLTMVLLEEDPSIGCRYIIFRQTHEVYECTNGLCEM